jgi:Cdc6-like AAA superfamily ATPase
MPFLSNREKKIIDLLKEKQLTSGSLFNSYNKSVKDTITLRRFREIVTILETKGLIKTEIVALKGRGRTKLITKVTGKL